MSSPASVSEILLDFLPSLGIQGVGQLHRFAVAGRMQERARSPEVEFAVAAAKARRKETGQPFWEALLSDVGGLHGSARVEILELAQYHHTMSEVAATTSFELSSLGLKKGIANAAEGLANGEILAISSRIQAINGEVKHLEMLDFRVPVTSGNRDLLCEHLTVMKLNGWLLDSGRSYHFLGRRLLDGQAGLSVFLGSALLNVPIVDGRWIAHQLIEGSCALRISSGNDLQIAPRLACEIY